MYSLSFPAPFLGRFLCAIGLSLFALDLGAGAQVFQRADPMRRFKPAKVPVGVNVGDIGFGFGGLSASSLPFTDLMKVAHRFDAVDQSDSYPVGSSVVPYTQVFTDIDSDGYPNEVVPLNGFLYGTYIARGLSGRYPAGTYLATFDGVGVLSFDGDVTSVTALSANQFQLEVSPSNSGIVMRILSSAGGSQRVRNLRVVPADLADANGDPVQTFAPDFLARVAALGPKAMRFTNWKRVVGGTVQTLAEELPETYYTYDRSKPGAGVPWSVIADLCATVGADAWVNVPFDADLEGYVRPLAQLFGDWSVTTGLNVLVEYGNEVWNPLFSEQYCWILDDQKNCVTCDPLDPPPVDGVIQQCIAEFNVAQSQAINGIFDQEFGARGIPNRRVRVLSGWASNTFYSGLLLGEVQASDTFDLYAVQSYFGSRSVQQVGWDNLLVLSDDGLVDYLHTSIDSHPAGNLRQFLDGNAALLSALNARLVPPDDIAMAAYEGGQSLTFNTCDCPGFCPSMTDGLCRDQIQQLSDKFNDLNRDAAMLEVYAHVFEEWSEVTADDQGVSGLWMHFSLFQEYGTAGQGSWGLFEYYDDPVAMAWKLLALQAVQQ